MKQDHADTWVIALLHAHVTAPHMLAGLRNAWTMNPGRDTYLREGDRL